MSGIYSTSPTAYPEISFVGAFPTNYTEQCNRIQYSITSFNTSGIQGKNIIGKKYEVLTDFPPTHYWKSINAGAKNLIITISIESPLTSEFTEKINQNTIHLFKCLILLYNLLVNTPEGLEEASETIEKIVEYYKDYEFHSQQTSFPQEQNVTQATMLPSKVRPPLVLDLD